VGFSISLRRRAYRSGVGELRCADGSLLTVDPIPCRDRGGAPFEITLELRQDGRWFGAVGERCGYFLATLAVRLAAARMPGSPQAPYWPDPDDRFPLPAYHWRDLELFAFRHRDRVDGAGVGELRCTVRTFSTWLAARPAAAWTSARTGGDQRGMWCGRGHWRLTRRAVVEAWGTAGRGVRATVTSGQLACFIGDVLDAAERAGTSYRDLIEGASAPR
jgi:hypothetical protein